MSGLIDAEEFRKQFFELETEFRPSQIDAVFDCLYNSEILDVDKKERNMSEVRLIDANALITELWNAMWKYEDETEKRFLESDELDVGDWFSHRIFVQNMSDLDRDVVQKQPTVDAVPVRCKDCKWSQSGIDIGGKPFTRCNGSVRTYGRTAPDWFCADGKRKEQSDG